MISGQRASVVRCPMLFPLADPDDPSNSWFVDEVMFVKIVEVIIVDCLML